MWEIHDLSVDSDGDTSGILDWGYAESTRDAIFAMDVWHMLKYGKGLDFACTCGARSAGHKAFAVSHSYWCPLHCKIFENLKGA